jgi:hypothetical protein
MGDHPMSDSHLYDGVVLLCPDLPCIAIGHRRLYLRLTNSVP